jgi:hypothetical protein
MGEDVVGRKPNDDDDAGTFVEVGDGVDGDEVKFRPSKSIVGGA